MTVHWIERREGGNVVALKLIKTAAVLFGRRITRLSLLPITIYFLIRRKPERLASRAYLRRALSREPSVFEIARHFHHFAAVTLDRVYFLTNQLEEFEARTFGLDELDRALSFGRGVLMVGAHVGSFDALRALSTLRPDVTLRVVLDEEHSPALSNTLRELDPEMAASIINPRKSGAAVAIEIGQALRAGGLVTLLADRVRPGNPTITVDFLGDTIRLPIAPWQIASALHVPIVLCVGLFQGRNRYDLHFQLLSEALVADRRDRRQLMQATAQRFADHLAALLFSAPYNWFNFYEFWNTSATAHQPSDYLVGDGGSSGS